MNRGALLLRATSTKERDIATAAECSPTAAGNYRHGRKRPGPDARAKLEAAFGIPTDAWDELVDEDASEAAGKPDTVPPAATNREPAPSLPLAGLSPRGAAAKARVLEDRIDRIMTRLSAEKISARDEAEIIGKLGKALLDLARLNGELEFTNARVLQLPFWRRICEVSWAALKDHPEAANKFAAAVEQLEIEASRAA
jgi:transcriptional regulator with XRE-family HTH domain